MAALSVPIDIDALRLVDTFLGERMSALLTTIQRDGSRQIMRRIEVESRGVASLPRAVAQSAAALVSDMQTHRAAMCSRNFSPVDMMTSVVFTNMQGGSIADCHRIVDSIRRDAHNMEPRPYAFQIRIIELLLQLAGPRIYGHYWRNGSVAIRKRNGWNITNSGVACALSGRKEGKSTAVAMGILVISMNISGYKFSLLARIRDQSKIIKDMVIDVAAAHPRFKAEFVVVRNSKYEFALAPVTNKLDIRTVHAHSGSPQVKGNHCTA